MEKKKQKEITVSKIPLQETRLFYWRYPQWKKLKDKLLPEIFEHQADNPNTLIGSNDLCWRGRKEYECQQDLFEPIGMIVTCWLENYFPNKLFDINIEYWTNINKPGSTNMIHNHVMASCHLSGVYYIQAENTGAIRFYTHEQLYNLIPDGMPYQGKIGHDPHDGDLLIWPSYLHHDVGVNLSTQERINIAFNATVKEKKNVVNLQEYKDERKTRH
jgi:uncharacterized protein (TIGR02466 family)